MPAPAFLISPIFEETEVRNDVELCWNYLDLVLSVVYATVYDSVIIYTWIAVSVNKKLSFTTLTWVNYKMREELFIFTTVPPAATVNKFLQFNWSTGVILPPEYKEIRIAGHTIFSTSRQRQSSNVIELHWPEKMLRSWCLNRVATTSIDTVK